MTRTKWEYKVVYVDYYRTEKHLNELGEKGWELMAFDMSDHNPGLDRPAHRSVFKRPKEVKL